MLKVAAQEILTSTRGELSLPGRVAAASKTLYDKSLKSQYESYPSDHWNRPMNHPDADCCLLLSYVDRS